MPVIDTSVGVVGVPLDVIWATLIDFETYPSYMSEVVSVEYIRRSDETADSAWCVLLNGSELRWTERDVFTPKRRITFVQLDGDIETWEGYWQVDQLSDVIHVTLHVEFDIGIPSLAGVLNPIGARAIKSNCRQMLAALQTRAIAEVSSTR